MRSLLIISQLLLVNTSPDNSTLLYVSNDSPYRRIQITSDLAFNWKISGNLLFGKLKYGGIGWLSLGFSVNGSVIDSHAIIGIPDFPLEGQQPVFKYDFDSESIDSVFPIGKDPHNIQNSFIYQDTISTELSFTKLLKDEDDEITIGSRNIFLWAVGRNNTFGYHNENGSFNIDLSDCDDYGTKAEPTFAAADRMLGINANLDYNKTSMIAKTVRKRQVAATADGDSSGYNKNAMIAHSILAALAWNFFTPVAVATACFYHLFPSTWIYLYVVGNLISYFLTMCAFCIALIEALKNPKVSYFSKPYIIIGLVIVALATFLVVHGTMKPHKTNDKDPKSALRAVWYTTHKTIGLSLLFLSTYHVYLGLVLFSNYFGEQPILPFYWTIVAAYLFAMCLIQATILLLQKKTSLARNSHGSDTT